MPHFKDMNLIVHDKKRALPYQFYFIPTLVLAISGIINSLYLAVTHYRNYTDLSWSSFCAISKAVNCDTVAQSPWSIFWDIPVAIWGVFGYLLFLSVLLCVRRNIKNTFIMWSVLTLLSLLFSLAALSLGYISTTQIGSYCILCIVSYIISFLLLLYSWIAWRRFGNDRFFPSCKAAIFYLAVNRAVRICLAVSFLSFILLKTSLPHYWDYETSISDRQAQTGFTSDGHPWFGSPDPDIIIEEFTDFQCFQCYKTHYALRRIIATSPKQVQLVHRHYPLDHEFNPVAAPQPFHVGSGKLALASIAAAKQNKFWDMNDLIFMEMRKKKQNIDLLEMAGSLGLDIIQFKRDFTSPANYKLLENDIRAGLQHKITTTPTFVIDGKVFTASLPEEELEALMDG
ncbi:vitamin K epoxide reductase family protein [Thermodesulfobacteriota bacterium]